MSTRDDVEGRLRALLQQHSEHAGAGPSLETVRTNVRRIKRRRQALTMVVATTAVVAATTSTALVLYDTRGAGPAQPAHSLPPSPTPRLTPTPKPTPTGTTTPSTAAVVPGLNSGNVPVLGRIWGRSQQGYGQVRPAVVYNGGDPTGLLTKINWASWGTARAVGAGRGWAPGKTVASGHWEPMQVVAFDLGPCRGHLAYRAIEWYSPSAGEHFNPHLYINICTGKYVGL